MATAFAQVKDNAQTLATSESLNNTTSPITISNVNTSLFDPVVNGYIVTIWDDVAYPYPFDDPNMEKALVTAATINATTGSFTLSRPQAKAHTGTPRVALLVMAQHISDIDTAVNSVENRTSYGPTIYKTGNFAAASNKRYSVDTTSGNVTMVLPATANLGDRIFGQKSDSTNNILYYSGVINNTSTSTFPVRTSSQAKILEWDGVSSWNVVGGDISLASLDTRYSQTFNVKAYGAVGDGVTNDQAAITAAIGAAVSAGGGIVYLPSASYVVTSSSRNDTVSVSGTTFTDAACIAGDVGKYVIGVGINGKALMITSVNPGVSFTTDAAPVGTPTSVSIVSPGLILPPGVELRGAGSGYISLGYGTLPTTSKILDTGTGVTILIVGASVSGAGVNARYGIKSLAVWGQNTNTYGVFVSNMAWFLTVAECDISFHGIANMAFDGNINTHDIRDTTFTHGGKVSATSPTGGVVTHPFWQQASSSLIFNNCFFRQNYGFGLYDGNTAGSFGVELYGCQFNNTNASAYAGSGVSAILQSQTMGTATVFSGWSETAVTNDLILNGPVSIYGFTSASTINIGWVIQSGVITAIGCVFSNHVQHSITLVSGAGIQWMGLQVDDNSFYTNGPASSLLNGIGSSTENVQFNPASATSVVNNVSLAPNLTSGQKVINQLGVVASPSNLGQMAFNYTSNGSASNNLSFGLFGQSNALAIFAAGLSLLLDTTITDAKNFILGTTTGTKFGTSISQKMAFYNATPVVQQTGSIVSALNALGLVASGTIAESDITNLTTDLAAKLSNITGLVTAGTNVTISGSGTSASPYIINATGGSGGGSGITRSIVTVNGTLTGGSAANVDYVYLLSTGAVYTQPTAVGNINRYTLKNITTNNLSVASTSSQSFDNGTLTISPGASVDIISDNANWQIV